MGFSTWRKSSYPSSLFFSSVLLTFCFGFSSTKSEWTSKARNGRKHRMRTGMIKECIKRHKLFKCNQFPNTKDKQYKYKFPIHNDWVFATGPYSADFLVFPNGTLFEIKLLIILVRYSLTNFIMRETLKPNYLYTFNCLYSVIWCFIQSTLGLKIQRDLKLWVWI